MYFLARELYISNLHKIPLHLINTNDQPQKNPNICGYNSSIFDFGGMEESN